jgi:integrase
MATIEKRLTDDGKVRYRVKIRLKGQPPITDTFNTKTRAKRWAADTEADIRQGRYFPTWEARKHTLGEAIDRYVRDILPNKPKCMKAQGPQLAWWKKQLGHYLLADITPAKIAETRDLLLSQSTVRKRQRSPATVVRYLAVLSHLMSMAIKEWGWLETNPVLRISKPKESRGRTRFLSEEELPRLLLACKESKNPYLYTAVLISLCTGMRRGELLNLTWTDVDFKRERITLKQTKNGDTRVIPLSADAVKLLKEFSQQVRFDTNLLFPGRGLGQKAMDLRASWEKALKIAGLSDFKWHDLRHTACSYLVMSGASISELSEIVGHKTLSMTKRYSHVSEQHAASVVSRMNVRLFETA